MQSINIYGASCNVHSFRTERHASASPPRGRSTWKTIRRANPLVDFNPYLRPKLEDERRKALRDEDARRRFVTYRLNRPQQAARAVLFTVDQWRRVEARPVPGGRLPARGGRRRRVIAVIGRRRLCCGLGAASTGCASLLVSLGSTSKEKPDAKRRGLYQKLADAGLLHVDQGRRVVKVSTLIDKVLAFPLRLIVCDRFRLGEVLDAVGGRCPVVGRVTRWSESTEDV